MHACCLRCGTVVISYGICNAAPHFRLWFWSAEVAQAECIASYPIWSVSMSLVKLCAAPSGSPPFFTRLFTALTNQSWSCCIRSRTTFSLVALPWLLRVGTPAKHS
jgi:hypothetical protein